MKKKAILLKINIDIKDPVAEIKSLEQAIENADQLIQQKSREFIKTEEKIFLTEKPVCNTNISYKKIYEITNNADLDITNYITPNKEIINLYPKELKIIEQTEHYFIICEINPEVIKADQNFKTVYEKIKINSIFNETLIPKEGITISKPDFVQEFQTFWKTNLKEIEVFYKKPVKINVEKTSYEVGNITYHRIIITNTDSDFENFQYETEFQGEIKCEKCIVLGDSLIFNIGKFKKGDNKYIEFQIQGKLLSKEEEIMQFEAFDKNYATEIEKYLMEKNEETLRAIICKTIKCKDDFENQILDELNEKILLSNLKKMNENATLNDIKFDEPQISLLEQIQVTSLNQTKEIVTYFETI